MSSDVAKILEKCLKCEICDGKDANKGKFLKAHVWNFIEIEILESADQSQPHLIQLFDVVSHWISWISVKSINAKEITKSLFEEFFVLGFPVGIRIVNSDTQFLSEFTKELTAHLSELAHTLENFLQLLNTKELQPSSPEVLLESLLKFLHLPPHVVTYDVCQHLTSLNDLRNYVSESLTDETVSTIPLFVFNGKKSIFPEHLKACQCYYTKLFKENNSGLINPLFFSFIVRNCFDCSTFSSPFYNLLHREVLPSKVEHLKFRNTMELDKCQDNGLIKVLDQNNSPQTLKLSSEDDGDSSATECYDSSDEAALKLVVERRETRYSSSKKKLSSQDSYLKEKKSPSKVVNSSFKSEENFINNKSDGQFCNSKKAEPTAAIDNKRIKNIFSNKAKVSSKLSEDDGLELSNLKEQVCPLTRLSIVLCRLPADVVLKANEGKLVLNNGDFPDNSHMCNFAVKRIANSLSNALQDVAKDSLDEEKLNSSKPIIPNNVPVLEKKDAEESDEQRCLYCNQLQFFTPKQLEVHTKFHKNCDPVLYCLYCNSSYTNWNNLLLHLLSHKEAKPELEHFNHFSTSNITWKCSLCNELFEEKKALEKHCKSSHPVTANAKTKLNNGVKRSKNNKGKAQTEVSPDVANTNNVIAPYTIINSIVAQANKRNIEPPKRVPGPPKLLRCPDCPYIENDQELFDAHMKAHKEHEEMHKVKNAEEMQPAASVKNEVQIFSNGIRCEQCGLTSKSALGFIQHLEKSHRSAKNIQCPYCSHIAPKLANLQEHLSTVHPKPFKCEKCGNCFKYYEALRRHMEKSHDETRPYPCPRCPFRAATEDQLNDHHQQRHEPFIPTFSCDYCPETFQTLTQLRDHMPTHTGDFLYVCKVCNYKSKFRHIIYQHTLEFHPNVPTATSSLKRPVEEDDDIDDDDSRSTKKSYGENEESTDAINEEIVHTMSLDTGTEQNLTVLQPLSVAPYVNYDGTYLYNDPNLSENYNCNSSTPTCSSDVKPLPKPVEVLYNPVDCDIASIHQKMSQDTCLL